MRHFRISYSRHPGCPLLYQFENIQGHRADNDGDLATMGEVGHEIVTRHVDFCSRKHIMRSEGHLIAMTNKLAGGCPDYLRGELEDVLERFQFCFNLDLRASMHITEVELAIDTDGKLCDPEDDTKDRLTGRPDHVMVYPDASVHIMDYKLGYMPYGPGTAKNSVQLKIYAYLWMMLHPECQKATGTVWGPRWGFNNRDSFTWTRETIVSCDQNPKAYFETNLNLCRMVSAQKGDDPWPHNSHNDWCKYCHPLLKCPDEYLKEVLEGAA